MRLPDDARSVLLEAEQRLVALAHSASQSRDYDGATALLNAARSVKLVADNEMAPLETDATAASSVTETPIPVRPPAAARRLRRDEYPRFLRDGETLIKVGWSKAEKSEYEHKSPRRVLQVLGTTLADAGAKGRRFVMDKILPLSDPADSTPLPDYQCYLCLALLRHKGLIVQHGRQGYSLPKNTQLLDAIERLWEQLPARA